MPYGENTTPELEAIVTKIMDGAFKVHRQFGAGLLESVYEACLVHELKKSGLKVQRQVNVPIYYDGVLLDSPLRLDLPVEDAVVVEIKAVEKMNNLFEAQVITYLKLTNKRIGLLINFNVRQLVDGFKRIIL
jgi:GxxExxY protein